MDIVVQNIKVRKDNCEPETLAHKLRSKSTKKCTKNIQKLGKTHKSRQKYANKRAQL